MKKWLRGTNAVVFSLAVIGIFIALNLVLGSTREWTTDLTADNKFTFSERTETTLKNIKKPVEAKVFLIRNEPNFQPYLDRVLDMLKTYDRKSGNFKLTLIDIQKEPLIAGKYEVSSPTVVFEAGEQQSKVPFEELFPEGGTIPFAGEQKFTQALINLGGENPKKLYFLTGHEELAEQESKAFRSNLETEGYVVAPLNLIRDTKIPDDADALFLLGPQTDLTERETKLISEYLKKDGKLMVTLDFKYDMPEQKNLNSILKTYGVTNTKGFVLQLADNGTGNPFANVPFFSEHKINEQLIKSDRPTYLMNSLALSSKDNKTTWKVTPLLKTSEMAFGKTNHSIFAKQGIGIRDLQQTPEDIAGPLDLAYAVEQEDGKSKMVVFGNTMMLTDSFFREFANRDFVMNSIAWVTGNENLVSIRPLEDATETADLSFGNRILLNVLLLGIVPLLFMGFGGFIWWRRRRR